MAPGCEGHLFDRGSIPLIHLLLSFTLNSNINVGLGCIRKDFVAYFMCVVLISLLISYGT